MNAYIVEAARTPFGSYFGSLSAIRPDDLLATTLKELMKKVESLDPSQIDDVLMGDSNGAGEDNRNVARMAALLAGFPESVPGATINRLCGSGAEALIQGSRAIRVGDARFVIAGGVESMSRAPWILQRSEKKKPESVDPNLLHQSTVGWRMTNPLFPSDWIESLGRCSEKVAQRLKISRSEQDEWSLRSHQRADEAWNKGLHHGFVFPFAGLERDESIRPETTMEILAGLKSAFSEGGPGTAGNSSPINDGAVAALMTDKAGIDELGIDLKNSGGYGRIIGSQVVATKPDEFSLAPVYAINKLLKKIDKSYSDINLWEINEAFASMVLTVLHQLPEIDREKVNVNGGAIAIGHPVGASAARVVIDATRELRRRGGGIAIAAACIGVGLGVAIAVEVN
jgi:acetyl-CoA acetyltransferase family protein